MLVGDVVVRVGKCLSSSNPLWAEKILFYVGDTPTSNLSHNEAHEVILKCGNNFVMGILRPDEEASGTSVDDPETYQNENGLSPFQQIQTPDSQAYSEFSGLTTDTTRTESRGEDVVQPPEISDDHIAELISGEAEVLKEHNVIGYVLIVE